MSSTLISLKEPLCVPAGEDRFHFLMGGVIGFIGLFSILGCWLTSVHVPDLTARLFAELTILCAFQALPVYLHTRGKIAMRDSSLMILWALLLWRLLPFPVDIAARLSRAFPLRDEFLARADAHMGVHIATVVHWASQNMIGRALNFSYLLLLPLLPLACLVPALTARVRILKRFLLANLAAFAIGLPLLAIAPAAGPWTSEDFSPRPVQVLCQSDIQQLRAAGDYVHHAAGVICFPSFHVMWAVLCAWTLFSFRGFRWATTALAAAIVLSTMTTGWHYFVDVLGGLVLALAAILAAHLLDHRPTNNFNNLSS